jgi:hypothetical protein
MHFLGGGWCWTSEDCYQRSSTLIGSSRAWGPTIPSQFYTDGFMSSDDPDFGSWSLAYIMYCDGSSYTSNASVPDTVNNTLVYHRGRRILDAILQDLVARMGPLQRVVVSGSSAGAQRAPVLGWSCRWHLTRACIPCGWPGGLTVYLHLDRIRAAFPATAQVAGLVDAGYFLNHSTDKGAYAYGDSARAAMAAPWHVAASSFDDGCASTHSADLAQCFFAATAFPHLATPIFVTNSIIDAWQTANVLQVGW